jgi:hypothetical protein
MRTFIVILLLIALLACQQSKQSVSLVIEDLKYSAYSWYYYKGQREFYLDYYVRIQKNGQFNLMLRDSFMSKPRYFTGIINETVRKLIDKTFRVDTFKTDYKSKTLQNEFYDGFTYCVDYRTKNNNQKKIIFIKSGNPNEIRKLSICLDTLIKTTDTKQINTVNLATYIIDLKKFSLSSLGPVPTLVMPQTKWEPVKITK